MAVRRLSALLLRRRCAPCVMRRLLAEPGSYQGTGYRLGPADSAIPDQGTLIWQGIGIGLTGRPRM